MLCMDSSSFDAFLVRLVSNHWLNFLPLDVWRRARAGDPGVKMSSHANRLHAGNLLKHAKSIDGCLRLAGRAILVFLLVCLSWGPSNAAEVARLGTPNIELRERSRV